MDYHTETEMAEEGCGLWFCQGLAPGRIKPHAAAHSLLTSRAGERIRKAHVKNSWLEIKTV